MQCEYRSAREGDLPALRELWKEAFWDGDRFLDQFFEGPFAPERSRVAVLEGAVSGALYWFPASCRGQSLAYLYGVATAARLRGRGLCSGLMADTQAYLSAQGIDGMLLVPGSASLFRFYARLGYAPCCPQGRMKVQAAGPALPLKPVSPRRYGELRRTLLPPGGVCQEGVNLEFQAGLSQLYGGKDLLLAATRQEDGTLLASELLSRDPIAAAPRILKTLKAREGIFRVPYPKGRPFAMFLPLATWQGPPPAYFGLAFD